MEIVTLAHIKLNRIGTAGGSVGGFERARQHTAITEAADEEIATLRNLVIEIAEANGEPSGALQNLQHESHFDTSSVVFNVQSRNTFYSSFYAECQVFPALKAGNRYFRLDEVKTQGTKLHRSNSE